MAYSSERSQEARRGFLDPRTKLALVLILALFVMGGLGGEALRPVKTVLSALPFLLLLIERQWARFLRGMLMLAVGYGLLLALPWLPGATILVVTHDSELIRACCSRKLSFSAKQTGNASVFPVS